MTKAETSKDNLPQTRVALAITGASGSIYAQQLLASLLRCSVRTYVMFSDTAKKVVATELPHSPLAKLAEQKQLRRFEENEEIVTAFSSQLGVTREQTANMRMFECGDLYSPIASGSEGATHMVVCPSSMGTLARIAHGVSSNLIERCADVMLKEKRTLVIVPRETPLSTIHLQNMLTLAQAGAHIVPAMPGFYHQPKTIDDVVMQMTERIVDALKIANLDLRKSVRWNHRQL